MALRGRKAEAAGAGTAQDLDQPIPDTASVAVADDLTGAGGAAPSDAVVTAPAGTDPAAAVSTAAASQVLGAILDQARESPAPRAAQDSKASAMRWFPVTDPVSLDGEDYAIGDVIGLTCEQHEGLHKAGVIDLRWPDGDEVF